VLLDTVVQLAVQLLQNAELDFIQKVAVHRAQHVHWEDIAAVILQAIPAYLQVEDLGLILQTRQAFASVVRTVG
jgi:hypothetical protein